MDARVFAELYAAVSLLAECRKDSDLGRLSSGRRLHRRRYAVRRMIAAVQERLSRARGGGEPTGGPSCLLPEAPEVESLLALGSAAVLGAAVISILSVAWQVPAESVAAEIARELTRSRSVTSDVPVREAEPGERGIADEDLDRRRPRKRKRLRTDARRGRPAPRARAA